MRCPAPPCADTVDPDVLRFMAEKLVGMIAFNRRPEHPVWQPEESAPDAVEPEDPETCRTGDRP